MRTLKQILSAFWFEGKDHINWWIIKMERVFFQTPRVSMNLKTRNAIIENCLKLSLGSMNDSKKIGFIVSQANF